MPFLVLPQEKWNKIYKVFMEVRAMQKKILGTILCSMGFGMLFVIFLPWWGFIAATIMVIVGGLLLFGRWC